MTTPQPDQQRRAAKRPDGGAAMDTFTVGFPRWLAVLFSRNPLIRLSDRIEVLALVLVVVVSLLSVPIGAAVGTAVYDSRSRVYAEQAKTRTTVTATVIDVPGRSDTTRVHARWFAAGSEHTGAVKARSVLKPGDSIDIPVDQRWTLCRPAGYVRRNRGGRGGVSDLVERHWGCSRPVCRHPGGPQPGSPRQLAV